MSWLSWDDDDDVEADDSEDDEDMVPTDQLSDLLDDADEFMDDADPDFEYHENFGDAWSEEELDDAYDPTDIEDFG